MSEGARGAHARYREIVTPEGVPLRFEIAPLGARAVAFVVDFVVLMAIGFFVIFGGVIAGGALGSGSQILGAITMALAFVMLFLVMNFYFTLLEIRWHGRTFGKRVARLRVIDRHGGELSGIGVCARNFMREVEFWLPMKILLGAGFIYGELPGWVIPLAALWALVLLLFPVFNRQRLRIGDLIGGTLVVVEPRPRLLPDLAAARDKDDELIEARFFFSPEQLEIYGIYELQVLEEVLRKRDADRETLALIAEKIKVKIGWSQAQWRVPNRRFLEDFYAAQRARLEQKAVMGRRQERKRE